MGEGPAEVLLRSPRPRHTHPLTNQPQPMIATTLPPRSTQPNPKHHPLRSPCCAGFVFCNMPPLRFILGQRVRFYVMALGTEVDMHTPNMERTVWREPSGASAMPALSMLPGECTGRVSGNVGGIHPSLGPDIQ